jgi:hypothetical protein
MCFCADIFGVDVSRYFDVACTPLKPKRRMLREDFKNASKTRVKATNSQK